VIYNIYFHPLRNFPGPLLHRASGLTWGISQVLGVQAFQTLKLHEQYGPVVRLGPNHLAFTDPAAWKDIYGHRVAENNSAPEMPKSPIFTNTFRLPQRSIVNAERDEHQKLRRGLSHGFSDSAMRQQEPVIADYVDLLIKQLHRSCDDGKRPLNLEAWYNWTTFDIVGDLVFGSAFGCLENMDYHPWIALILAGVKYASIPMALGYVGLSRVAIAIYRSGLLSTITTMQGYITDFVRQRLGVEKERSDLFEGLVKRRKEWASCSSGT
jgi:cytochrome P450